MEIDLTNIRKMVNVGDLVKYAKVECFVVEDYDKYFLVNARTFIVESSRFEKIEDLINKCGCNLLAKNEHLLIVAERS